MFHYVVDSEATTTKMQTQGYNETAHMLLPYNKATTCYNILTSNF